jgi:hypothetical protein
MGNDVCLKERALKLHERILVTCIYSRAVRISNCNASILQIVQILENSNYVEQNSIMLLVDSHLVISREEFARAHQTQGFFGSL